LIETEQHAYVPLSHRLNLTDKILQLRTVIEKLASSIDVKQSDHEALDVEIKTVAANNKLFYEQATKVDQIIAQVDTLRRQRNLVQENAVHILSTAKELNGSSSVLLPRSSSTC
jgi:DNA repair protein RAD50